MSETGSIRAPSIRPILVAGSHRSGTGWVSKLLAEGDPPLGYVWEPWSPARRPGTFPVDFGHWYHYTTAENASAALAQHVRDLLAFRYRPVAELRSLRSPKDAARMIRDWRRFNRYRREHRRPLLKDPIALFSAEWLAQTFAMDVVLIMRHPAAFVASLVHRGWRHDFQTFIDQPLLMRDWLGPFRAEIELHAGAEQPAVDEAILLWNILYTTVHALVQRHPDWLLVIQEDLADDPMGGFERLFDQLGVGFGSEARAAVADSSSANNPTLEDHGGSIRRNSAEHRWNWTRQLSTDDIAKVRAATFAISDIYYGPEDWDRSLNSTNSHDNHTETPT